MRSMPRQLRRQRRRQRLNNSRTAVSTPPFQWQSLAIVLPRGGVFVLGDWGLAGEAFDPISLLQQAAIPGPGHRSASKGFAMTRLTTLNAPFMLGFDEIERALDRVARGGSEGYPPYNIERMVRVDDQPERLRITLAVAGFTRDQLDITLEENQLVIRGRQIDDKPRQYLHRGIAARQFQRSFLLAEGMRVMGADLVNGLLCVDLVRPEPERVVQRINILVRD